MYYSYGSLKNRIFQRSFIIIYNLTYISIALPYTSFGYLENNKTTTANKNTAYAFVVHNECALQFALARNYLSTVVDMYIIYLTQFILLIK